MNNKKFAGFNLDDVFNNEEERLRKEKDEEEARKRKSALEEKLKNKKGPAPVAPAIPSPAIDPAPSPAISTYLDLEFEPTAHREPGKTDKALLYFDASQQRIISAGYERHAFSSEAFGLIIAHLKKELTPALDEVVQDMLTSFGEFFCQAIETKRKGILNQKSTATIYELVTALPRNAEDNGYDKTGLVSGAKKEFDVTSLKLEGYTSYKNIHDKHDDLIKYLTSKSFAELPEEIQESGGIYLPQPGAVWPVGRVSFGSRYDICIFNRASRGVRRAKNFAGNKGSQ